MKKLNVQRLFNVLMIITITILSIISYSNMELDGVTDNEIKSSALAVLFGEILINTIIVTLVCGYIKVRQDRI